jgi:hypothetical protein
MKGGMRVRSFSIAAVAGCIIITTPGCLEIETTTQVRRDESLHRTVVLSGDSTGVPGARIILGIDSSWILETRQEDKKYILTARHEFETVEDMARALRGIPGRSVTITPRLETRFNWFFTTFRYNETWSRLHNVNEVPLSDYVSPAELDMFMRHELGKEKFPTKGDSLALSDAEDRYNEWDSRNWFEAYYKIFLEGVRELGDSALPVDSVVSRKEDLFSTVGAQFSTFSDTKKRARDLNLMGAEFARVLQNPAALRAAERKSDAIALLANQRAFVENFAPFGYKVRTEMPGLITNTNAPAVNGNTVTWEGFEGALYITDYDMWVESRAVNWWAVGISALLLLVVAALSIAGIMRRRKSAVAA